MKRHSLAAGLAAALLLSACGGGGGGRDDDFIPPTSDFDAFAAWQNLLDPPAAPAARSWNNIRGRGSDGNVYTLALSVEAAPDATFPLTDTDHFVTELHSTLSANGTLIGTGQTDIFFDADWFVRGLRIGSTTVQPGGGTVTSTTCDEVTATALPATAARVGTGAALYDATIRETCTVGAPSSGTSLADWSVGFDERAGIVFLCITTEDRGLGSNPVVTTEQDCIEIDADGNLGTRARITLTGNDPPFDLVARNY